MEKAHLSPLQPEDRGGDKRALLGCGLQGFKWENERHRKVSPPKVVHRALLCLSFSSSTLPLPTYLPPSLSALPLPLRPHRNSLSLSPACAPVLSAFQRFMHETNYALLIWKLAALLLTFI